MPIDPVTGNFLLKAALKSAFSIGKSILNQRFGKPKRFENTPEGRRLKRQSERGSITAGMRSEEIGETSRAVGAVANRQAGRLRGRLISQGVGGSIAGVRAEADIGTGVQRAVSRTARNVTRRNEASKVVAKEQLAAGRTASDAARRDFTRRNIIGAVSGVAQAGTELIGDRLAAQQAAAGQVAKEAESKKERVMSGAIAVGNNLAKLGVAEIRNARQAKSPEELATAERLAGFKERTAEAGARGAEAKALKAERDAQSRGGNVVDENKTLQQNIDNLTELVRMYQPRINPQTGIRTAGDQERADGYQRQLDRLLVQSKGMGFAPGTGGDTSKAPMRRNSAGLVGL